MKAGVIVIATFLAAVIIFAAVWMVPKGADGAQVNIEDLAFSPNELSIEVGTTVTWTNLDAVIHDVVFEEHDEGDHDHIGGSGDLERGDTWSYTFDEIGTFHYHCHPHPFMEGMITVIGS